MCLILFANKVHPKYKLILAANRDEFYERPTRPAQWWEDKTNLLAGKDLQGGGTWLGITKSGRIAVLTNYRKMPITEKYDLSRGMLVIDFLDKDVSESKYFKELKNSQDEFDGYNLLFGSMDALYWFSNKNPLSRGTVLNRLTAPTPVEIGIHGLSNHLLNTSWPKVDQGKKALSLIIDQSETLDPKQLFDMLHNTDLAADEELPNTGIGIDYERVLSAAFIKSPGYGTRLSTVILIDYDNNVYFEERSYIPESSNQFEFVISPN